MRLDRNLQRTLLNKLADKYPHPFDRGCGIDFTDPEVIKSLLYLQGHALVVLEKTHLLAGPIEIKSARATERGMDFLEDDGGLSAILSVVTVKLHSDTIKELIGKHITESDLPEPEKKRWLDTLRELPAEASKNATLRLMEMGLEKGGNAAMEAIKQLLNL